MNTGLEKTDAASRARLVEVNTVLNRLFTRCASYGLGPFSITEGMRTRERQVELVESGASKTLNSRHLTGHAVDVGLWVQLDGKLTLRWDWPLYEQFAQHVQLHADALGIKIVWGGSWKTFKDGPHFQLDEKIYP